MRCRLLPAYTAVLLAVLFCALYGCGKPGGQSASAPEIVALRPNDSGGADAATAQTAAEGSGKTAPALPRKIIYQGTVELATEDLPAAARKITEQVKAFGGYIAESTSGTNGSAGETRTATWKVRIPAERFDAFLTALGGIGETQNRQVTSEDVSEEFYDAAARLKNKRVEEERLLTHLRASGKLADVLLLEKEVSRVREEIERIEGRLRFLSSQADLSTIDITLREIKGFRADGPPSLGTAMRRTFASSLSALGELTRALVLVAVALLPWALIGAGIAVPLRIAYLRRKKETKPHADV